MKTTDKNKEDFYKLFKPQLTPQKMLEMGVFGGSYFGEKIEEYVVEIKPKAQLQKPKEPKRKTAKALKNFKYAYESYVRNLCKTNALNKMAKQRNCKVMLLTEDSKLF